MFAFNSAAAEDFKLSLPLHANPCIAPTIPFPCKFYCCFSQVTTAVAFIFSPFSTLMFKTTSPCILGHCLSMLPVHTLRLFFLSPEDTITFLRTRASSVGISHSVMELNLVVIWPRPEMVCDVAVYSMVAVCSVVLSTL